jgi:LIM domain
MACQADFQELFGETCSGCGLKVSPVMQLKFKETFWHPECMKCAGPCAKPLGPSDKLFSKDGLPCCEVRNKSFVTVPG